MSKNITLTIPMDYFALTRASDMLHGLAMDLEVDEVPDTSVNIPAPETITMVEPVAAEVFAEDPKPAPIAPTVTETAGDVAPSVAESTDTPDTDTNGVDTAPATTNPSALIPWDHRIHSSSKAKLAKKPHGWKMKRGVDASIVATVEAELISVMQIPAAPAATETPNEPSAPAPAPAPAAVSTETTATTAPAAISTFPELMTKITSSKTDQTVVTAALAKHGIASLPLVAARPDLIPAIAADLFPGG